MENMKPVPPPCDCQINGKPGEYGLFYSHLGAAASLPKLRQDLESRTGFSGDALCIEQVSDLIKVSRVFI